MRDTRHAGKEEELFAPRGPSSSRMGWAKAWAAWAGFTADAALSRRGFFHPRETLGFKFVLISVIMCNFKNGFFGHASVH